MSFLSRRPSRSGNRGSDAVREDEYDDYDYAPDGYARDARSDEDENWSANEYFSPDGIKGRWATGHQPGENPAVRGNRGDRGDIARGDSGRDRQERARGAAEDYDAEPHQGGGYGTDDYATGGYELPDGTDEERTERGGRRRKTRGEWGSRLGLRRDRGEDIWPDDGVSDEDYWASVAADRPLTPSFSPLDADPVPTGADQGQPTSDPRLGGDSRPGNDPRFGAEQRGGTGRLGPAPGLVGDVSAPGRPATGPHAIRPNSGNVWAGQALAAATGGVAQPDIAQPSFSPNGRQQDRPDWGERTERIDRVNASGYPDQRPSGRGHSSSRSPGSRADSGSWTAVDRREPSRDSDREPSRNSGGWPAVGRNNAKAPAQAAGDDDPLTSTAYSRAALADADGRSYRVAARRSEAQSKLTEETQTFTAPGQYPGDRYPSDQYQVGQRSIGQSHTGEHQTRRYPTGGTGEYGQYGAEQYGTDKYSPDQYRGGQQRGDAQEPTARYPAYGSQPSGQQPGQSARQGQPVSGRPQGQAPQQPGQPGSGQPAGSSGRVSLPGASGSSSGLTGQYQAQQPRQAQQTRQPQQQPRPQPQSPQPQQARQSAQSALPAGENPYESAATGAYPYPGQTGYPARQAPTPGQPQAQAAPGSTGRDDRRRRQPPPDGYGTGGPDHGNQDRGAGAGYGGPRDGRY